MYRAFLYLNFKSAENLIRSRLSRLRQPKYLLGLIVGGFWIYTFVVRRMMGAGVTMNGHGVPSLPPELLREMIIRLGAVVILGRAIYAWALPDAKSGIIFTVPEIAFLFPAPISRKELIRYKLFASQTKILFSSFFLMVVSNRWSLPGGNWATHAIGWWVILSTMALHGTAASLTISRLIERGVSAARRRVWVFGIVGFGVLMTVVSVVHSASRLPDEAAMNPTQLASYFLNLLDAGALHWLLAPFKLATAPIAAIDTMQFLKAMGPALLLLAAHFYWALSMEGSFEEAAIAASEKRAARIASAKAGTYRIGQADRKVRRPAFPLGETGRPELAFLWKNLLSAPSFFTPRVFLSCAVVIIAVVSWVGRSPEYSKILLLPLILVPGIASLYIFLVGPQLARQDMRSDLPNSDILKAYPLRGWQVIAGEILTPVAILTGLIWLALITSTTAAYFYHTPGETHLPVGQAVFPVAAAAAIVIPILCAMQMIVANSVVILFPGWQSSGSARSQGMEVMGQRILLSFGRMLVMALAILPPALCGTLMAGTSYFFGTAFGATAAGITVFTILVTEFAIALRWLGNRFEKMDLSTERI